ncbi:EAL domain-containing protein [Acidihalobacter prosperus]
MSRFAHNSLWSNPDNLAAQLRRFVGLDDDALVLVRRHAETLGAQASDLATHFYDYLLSHAETASVFDSLAPERLEALAKRQAEHFRAMLSDWPLSAQREAPKVAQMHYSHGVSPTWIAGAYNLYREHLESRLEATPSDTREALRQAAYRLLMCDLMLQLAALDNVHSDTLAERNVITQTLLETTLKLADLPTPEEVFSSICTNLVTHSRHLPAVWFTLQDESRAVLRPFSGAGSPSLWEGLEASYDPNDPLWQALEQNRSIVLRARELDTLPAWWPQAGGIEAAAIFPFGRSRGIRGLGVVFTDHAWYFDHVDLSPFDAFARLGQVLLSIKENQLRDPLTNLPNRALFMDRLHQGLLQARRRHKLLGIGMIDLDGFKDVNDRLGHISGDKLLREVAKRFADSLRRNDTIARLGGDEFGLVLADLRDVGEAESVILRLQSSLDEPFQLDGEAIRISASLGLTLYPLDDVDNQDLLRHADVALYQAKDEGRHTYRIFEQATEVRQRQVGSLQRRFEQALDSGQLIFHYQPKVDIALGHVIGVEALVRWRREAELVPPENFITAVEASPHLIRRLGRHALLAAATQVEQWRSRGRDVCIAVNIGAEHLLSPAFVDDVDEVLALYPAAASHLELEVTERAALRDLAQTRAALAACRERGLSVALDDYGTGHASLTYLQELPANQIKLDKRFVQKLLDEPRALAIIAGNLTAANLLDLEVIAEGVETHEQGELLLQLGCRYAQGFAIARPMPAEDLEKWMAQWRPPADWAQWHDNLFTQQDLPFLMARTAHRHSLHAMLEALATPPSPEQPFLQVTECVDESLCALGRWLRGAGQRYRSLPAFKPLVGTHAKTHAQAIEATLAWQSADETALAREIERLQQAAFDMDRQILELARQIGLQENGDRTAV